MRFARPIFLIVLAILTACAGQNGEAVPDRAGDTASVAHPAGDSVPGREAGRTGATDTSSPGVADRGDSGGWTGGVTAEERTPSGSATVSAVRIAAHEGYDRIVVELDGSAIPGYRIERLAGPAIRCGSGFVVEMEGEDLIQLTLEPAQAHTEAGEPTLVEREWAVGLPVIAEVVLTCDFEGQVVFVAGVAEGSRYRVLELSDPARLVLDVTAG